MSQQQPRINNGILVGGTVRIGGNLITTQNSGNITTTTYSGGNYTGAINSGNKGGSITNSGNTDSSVHHGSTTTTTNTNSNNQNSNITSNNNSGNVNSGNTNSGNNSNNVTNTNSNNTTTVIRTPLPSNYQLDVPVTPAKDMLRALARNGFQVNAETNTQKEKMIHSKTYLLPPAFLKKAQDRSNAVCFIENKGCGTGFMISEYLLMTAQHVIETAEIARNSKVTFGYDSALPEGRVACDVYHTKTWSLDPDTFFIQDPDIDVAICAISSEPKDQKRDWTPIPIRRNPSVVEGDCFNIIQHPSGGPKKFALRGWKLKTPEKAADKGLVQYDTDTMPGSSGSPVFNDFWEVVAVHNSSVQDEKANQGTYIDVVIDWMLNKTANFKNHQKELVDALKLEQKSNEQKSSK